MLKRFLSLALAVLMTLSLCSCDFRSLFGGEQTSSDNVKDDPIVGDGSSYSEFINVMKEIKMCGAGVYVCAASSAEGFWKRHGYRKTERTAMNGLKIFVKSF